MIAPSIALLLLSGFSLHPSLIPADQIISGGPPKDGIPALTQPRTESAESANTWLKGSDRILGVVINGHARAYPIRILNWHEIVNDRIGEKRFVVTYCPLCGSGMVFNSKDEFGVSGLLYQSDVLLYDHATKSLWSQLMAKAVTGPRMGEALKPMLLVHTSWSDWFRRYPGTDVLSRETGYRRDYNRDPYVGYDRDRRVYFPVAHWDERLHPKAWVIGLEINGKARAWDIIALSKAGMLHETWVGRRLLIRYHRQGGYADIIDEESGVVLPTVTLYWFAWAAFHPQTELYNGK